MLKKLIIGFTPITVRYCCFSFHYNICGGIIWKGSNSFYKQSKNWRLSRNENHMPCCCRYTSG